MNQKLEGRFLQATYYGLFALALFTFTSMSASALGHILIIIPSFYFFLKALKDPEVKIPKSLIFMGLIWLTSVLSVAFNFDIIDRPLKQIFRTKYYLVAFLSSFAFYYLKKNYLTEKREKHLVNAFLLATTLATICGLIGLWSGYTPLKFREACHPRRACGLYGMYMSYGYGISMFSSLVIGVLLTTNRVKELINRKLLIAGAGINSLGMILSYARGGWLGFILSFPFLYFKKSKKFFIISIGTLTILFGVSLALSERVQQVFLKRTGSNVERLSHFQGAIAAFKERPIFGVGFKNYEPLSSEIKKRNNIPMSDKVGHAHSNYLEQLASTGVLGALSLVLFICFWLVESYSIPALFIFVLNFFTSGFTQYTFGDGENLFLILTVYSFFALPLSRKNT